MSLPKPVEDIEVVNMNPLEQVMCQMENKQVSFYSYQEQRMVDINLSVINAMELDK
jgi:hypothetical protein